jgi:collagenase-like PrtC family protease
MTYALQTTDAYRALLDRIESGEPVVATFRMANMYGTVMEIEVDGVQQGFYFNIRSDGTWDALHRGEL